MPLGRCKWHCRHSDLAVLPFCREAFHYPVQFSSQQCATVGAIFYSYKAVACIDELNHVLLVMITNLKPALALKTEKICAGKTKGYIDPDSI